MSRRVGVLAIAGAIALVACANGGDPSNDYQLPQGDDGAGGDDGSPESSASGSSSGSSGGSSGSGSSSGGNSSNGGDDAGGDDGGGGPDSGGGTPTSCMSPDMCSASAMTLTSIAGDQSGATDNATGTTSEWLRIDLTEQDNSPVGHPMKLTAVLTSPSGSNFDLYAYLGSKIGDIQCTTPKAQSTNPAGQTDTVSFEWGETGTFANGKDDSATVMLEIRWASGACSSGSTWSLAAHGN
ncbi:MAG TPA: hypothetical protein VF765_09515 [Polyangiaceae bacterium]